MERESGTIDLRSMRNSEPAIYDKIVITVAVVVCLLVGARAEPDIRPTGYSCFGQFDPLSDNQEAVQIVLDRLIDNTADRGYNYYTRSRRGRGARCYGNGRCRLGIPAEDCMTCLIVTETMLKHLCGYPGTAILVLVDCGIRWQFNRIED